MYEGHPMMGHPQLIRSSLTSQLMHNSGGYLEQDKAKQRGHQDLLPLPPSRQFCDRREGKRNLEGNR
jgi:hypothetical protein